MSREQNARPSGLTVVRLVVPFVAILTSGRAEASRVAPNGVGTESLVIWDGSASTFTQNTDCGVSQVCTADRLDTPCR